MRQILYICLGIILLSIVSCYDDKGNYDYHDINEVIFGDIETAHNVLLNIDTLKINLRILNFIIRLLWLLELIVCI